jgi:hypothetical protein
MQERGEVEVMLRAGKPLGQIRDRVEEMPVDEEAKSVLWLLAWCERGRGRRRRDLDPTGRPLARAGYDRGRPTVQGLCGPG